HSLISAIPIPDPQLEKNKVLYTYDPSIHDYSVDGPELVNIGHDHYVYGNKKEIEEYKRIREKGETLQPIRILKPGEEVPKEEKDGSLTSADDQFLKAPVHDTGSKLYVFLSFCLPIIALIVAQIFKHKQYYRNYHACKKGAIAGLITLAVIIIIFLLFLGLAII
ncbi:MAG: peptide ABC transporter ATP-binding protein, partial [Lachnospiraceae bacterium]|nr:peptide ABC transporter ATP-binding protein [Lachnospiraceae bacterium]